MRNTRRHAHYPVRFGIFKPTDRSDTFYHGYIYDINTRKHKRWNTREPQQRDAWKRVSEMIESIYASGLTVADALRNEEIKQESLESVLEGYLKKYDDQLKSEGKPAHKQIRLYRVRQYAAGRVIKLIGSMSPHSLNQDVVNDYIKQRQTAGAAIGTIKQEIELIRTALRKILKERGAAIIHKMKGHFKLKPADEKTTTIPLDRFEQIVEKLPDWMKLPIRLQHHTGCRPSEIRELRWRNVNIDEGCLKFDSIDVKENKPRTVYLDDYFCTALAIQFNKAEKNEHGVPVSEYVFHSQKSDRIPFDTYYYHWNSACDKCGFVDFSKNKSKGKAPLYHLHDLRRNRISALLKAGIDIKTVQNQVGHSGVGMTLRYAQPEKEIQKELAKKINGIDKSLHDRAKERLKELEAEKKRLEDVIKGIDVWETDKI